MCTLLMPMDRSFMRSSVAFRLMRWAIVWSVTSLSMRMTFLCALISCVEIMGGRRGGIGPEGRRPPAPPGVRPIIGRPGC